MMQELTIGVKLMKNLIRLTIPVIVFVLLLVSCAANSGNVFDKEKELKEVEKTINTSIAWAVDNKNLAALHKVIWQDENYLSVNPGKKVVRGFKDFRKSEDFWMSQDFKAIRCELKELKINFAEAGNVAWWYCVLDDINEWKGKPANWENVRWTGVLEKKNGTWVIVQMHFSFPDTTNN